MAQAPDAYTATASIDIEAPPDRVYDLIADVGFRPATSIETGVARFVEWYRSYHHLK